MQIIDNIAISLLAKPFVVLYGPSGTGKTLAAIQLALKINSQYFMNNWFDITVNKYGAITSGNSEEFQAMVQRNESRDNNFILRDGQNTALTSLEFCENINFYEPKEQRVLLREESNQLQLAASINTNISCYKVIPVGSNWTDNKPLIGYINPFGANNQTVYEITPFIELLLLANHPENTEKPFFAILDEMNLSHVEYYLSDILSIMETAQYSNVTVLSDRDLNLIANTLTIERTEYNLYLLEGIQHLLNNSQGLPLPPNFFVVGTINLDETTQMLSNKVLDRAHLIKIDTLLPSNSLNNQYYSSAISDIEMCNNFEKIMKYKRTQLLNSNFEETYDYLVNSLGIGPENKQNILSLLDSIYKELITIDQQFGYRITQEVFIYLIIGLTFYNNTEELQNMLNNSLNQKVFVKLNGNRRILYSAIQNLESILTANVISSSKGGYFNNALHRLENFRSRLELRGQATFIS